MTEAGARVMARIEAGPPEISDDVVAAIVARWGVQPPDDLVAHWRQFGSGEGFGGPDGGGEYLRFLSPAGALHHFTDYEGTPPPGMLPIGTNGGSEMIVYAVGRGYGLIQYINSGPDDLWPVAATLDAFFADTESGTWFDEAEP